VRFFRLKPRRIRSLYFLDDRAFVVVSSWVTDVSGQDNGPIFMGQTVQEEWLLGPGQCRPTSRPRTPITNFEPKLH